MADSGTFQVNTDDLSSTAPKFQAASTAIGNAASSLKTTVSNSISYFDGNTHKNLQTLGNNCAKNLQDLANAMADIATRLQKSASSTKNTDHQVAHGFDPNS
jgi:uncharacterized protein YukE